MCPSSSITEKILKNFEVHLQACWWEICVSFKEQMQCHRLTHPLKKTKARSTFLDRQVFCDFLIWTIGFLSWLTIIITFPAFIKHTGTGYPLHKTIESDLWRLLSKEFFLKLYRWFQCATQTENHWSNYISSQLPKILSLGTASFGLSNCFLVIFF